MFVAPLVDAQEAPEQTIREAREQQEQVRREKAELAKQLDLLEASDAELLEALATLNEEIAAQELRVEGARIEVEQAQGEQARLDLEIAELAAEVAELREMTIERAVAAYVAPRGNETVAGDPTEAARRDALFRQVDLDGRDLIDQLRAATDDLDLLETQASAAAQAAAERQADYEAQIALLEEDVAAQERLRTALAEEIAHLEEEIEAMAAAESEIQAIIRDSQREIARREALARAATSTTTTTTSTTTTTIAEQPSGGESTTTTTADSPDAATTTTTTAPVVLQPAGDPDVIWPSRGAVTSPYGNRVHPITGGQRFHAGIDIDGDTGDPIWAAQSGTVIYSGWMSGYGETIMIDHNGYVTLYGHMSQRQISKGSAVSQGQQIGLMGSTGNSTGSHLHFEIRIDGSTVNPMAYLP